jgi:hypothetical protein
MTVTQRGLALVGSALVTLLLVTISNVSVPVHRSTDALLRVAMSARPERIEVCREVPDSELVNTPAHMRQRSICEGAAAAYLLEVLRNGQLLSSDTVRGGGLRNDRQLYVLSDHVVPSGTSHIEVRFRRIDNGSPSSSRTGDSARTIADHAGRTDGDDDDADRERIARARRIADAIPHALLFHETVSLIPREVMLVTYDRESRNLRKARSP